jgi:hypothetical protein
MAEQCKCRRGSGGPKKAYRSELAAYRMALRSSYAAATGMRVYRCPDGAGWHLTAIKRRRHAS